MKKKKLSLPAMPLKVLESLESWTHQAAQRLSRCETQYGSLHVERAITILRAIAVPALLQVEEYYTDVPGFEKHWPKEILKIVIEELLRAVPSAHHVYTDDLRVALYQYVRSDALSQLKTEMKRREGKKDASQTLAKATPKQITKNANRKELFEVYRSALSEKLVVLDFCWAAHQHYSEFKRWLRGATVLKDGSAPDKAFRNLITSEKHPHAHRKEPRPDGWK